MAETIYTVDPGGTGNYASQNAYVGALAGDYGGNDPVCEFFSSDGSADTSSVNHTGFSNYTNYIIRPHNTANAASTSFSTSKYRHQHSAYQGWVMGQDNSIVQNMQQAYTCGGYAWNGMQFDGLDFLVDGCFIQADFNTQTGGIALYGSYHTGADTGNTGIFTNGQSGTHDKDNNTVIGDGYITGDAGAYGGTHKVTNGAFQNCGSTAPAPNTTSYNVTDLSDLSGTGDTNSTTLTFAGTGDYAPASTDTALINAGTDLSAKFTNDIDGNDRTVPTYFGRGASLYVSGGGTSYGFLNRNYFWDAY